MSRGVNLYARLLLGLQTRDNSGAYRCYIVAKLRELDFAKFRAWIPPFRKKCSIAAAASCDFLMLLFFQKPPLR